MAAEQYWIVVSDSRGPAMQPARHRSEALAIAEARRLAVQNPGDVFTVFATVCAVVSRNVQITPLRPHFDDEIPF